MHVYVISWSWMPMLLSLQMVLTVDVNAPIDPTECGKSKGCFRSPGQCVVNNCRYFLTWRLNNSTGTVDFEYSANTTEQTPWIALGFSNDTKMSGTSVVDCIVNVSADGPIAIQSSYNPGHYNEVLSPDNQLGLVSNRSRASFSDGRLICRFTRIVKVKSGIPQSDMVADLSRSYYLFLGQGPAQDNGEKSMHTVIPTISARKISVFNNDDIHDGRLIVLHASFMIIAWMFMSTIGILCSRHYKNVWNIKICGVKIWFQIHRLAMGLTLLLSTTAAAIIFVDLSATPLLSTKLHPILGMIVLCLMVINVVLGLVRPSPGSGKRQLFNWTHCLVGNGAHLTAVATMYFGVRALAARMDVASWLQWVVVAYGTWRILIDVILTIEKYYHREDLRVAYVEMSGSADDIVVDDQALNLKKTVLCVYIVGVTGLTVATLYGTISPFYHT